MEFEKGIKKNLEGGGRIKKELYTPLVSIYLLIYPVSGYLLAVSMNLLIYPVSG